MTINWGRAFGGALIAQIAQIAAAFGWVAIYSYVIDPGQPIATYQAHAQASGPWVSILAFERSIDIDTYDRHAEKLREDLTLARLDRHSGQLEELDVEGILAFADGAADLAGGLAGARRQVSGTHTES